VAEHKLSHLILVGLGLNDEYGLTLRGLESAKDVDLVFIETYTSSMPGMSMSGLSKMLGKEPVQLVRKALEEDSGRILDLAKRQNVAILIPGDPLIATTHIQLAIEARKLGVEVKIISGVSILSAAISLSGLQNYKFGKSVTLPFVRGREFFGTPFEVVKENRARGLHTLIYLDVNDEGESMPIREALELIMKWEEAEKIGVFQPSTLCVGLARLGSEHPVVKAGLIEELRTFPFGSTPHIMIFPGHLHFVELEALRYLANASKKSLESVS
jgi:diphthine synthase